MAARSASRLTRTLTCCAVLALAPFGAKAQVGPAATPAPTAAPAAEPATPGPTPAPAADDKAERDLLDRSFVVDRFNELSVEDMLNATVSVSTAKPEKLSDAPSTVSVIDRRTIELYGFRTVTEAIETLAGVEVIRTYLKRDIPIVRGILQDHYANKVLVLVDGVPTWMAVTGEGNYNRIGIDQVERIEVLKGPSSVLYGTNAFSGAINLVLRKSAPGEAKGRKVGVVAQAGSGHHYSAAGSYALTTEKVALSVSASASDERGTHEGFVDEKADWGHLNEFMQAANITATAQVASGFGDHQLLFNAYRGAESYLGVTPVWTAGIGKPHQNEGYLASYRYSLTLAKSLDLRATGLFDWNQRSLSRSFDDNTRSRVTGYRAGGGLMAFYHPASWLELELGGEADYRLSDEYANVTMKTDKILEENFMKYQDVSEASVFLQTLVRLEEISRHLPINLRLGGRYTVNQLFDKNFSLTGSAIYHPFDHSTIKLIAGQSFRAPTLFELYFQTSTKTVFGNTGLAPERNQSFELQYLFAKKHFYAQLVGYRAKYEDRIYRTRRDPSSATDKSTIYENGSPFSAWGAEAEIKYADPELIDAFLNYALVKGDDGDKAPGTDHYNFKYVPEHMLTVGLAKRLGPVTASTVLRYVGKRNAPLETLPAVALWDATLSYGRERAVHMISAKDLLDQDQLVPEYTRQTLNAVPSGYGRTIRYTFRYSFD